MVYRKESAPKTQVIIKLSAEAAFVICNKTIAFALASGI